MRMGMSARARKRGRPGVKCQGFTLVEVLSTLAIAAILLAALGGVVQTALAARDDSGVRNALARDAGFAMERMLRAVSHSPRLLIPLVDKLSTAGVDESLRDPGVLAVSLDPLLDRDLDGIADADNDGDGRVDEDTGADWTNDAKPGIAGIDDDGGGAVDEGSVGDDDETGFFADGDPVDGIDNDGDQNVDEDPPADVNGDGAPGSAAVDDDGDGSVDEGNVDDDDEDGVSDEDWIDPVVFFLSGGNLIERFPNPGSASGNDYSERVIAEGVTTFIVQRLPRSDERADRVAITLTLGNGDAVVKLDTRVRVGGSL